jgi:hypothetical protein
MKKKEANPHQVDAVVSNPYLSVNWRLHGPRCKSCIYHFPMFCRFNDSAPFQTFRGSLCDNYTEKD